MNWDDYNYVGRYGTIAPELVELIDKIPVKKTDAILDVAAGNGRFSIYFSKKAKKIYSLDNNQLSINVIKSHKISNIKAIKCDITKKLPFPDNSFDLVFSAIILQHIKDKNLENVVKEMKRVSKGRILLIETTKGTASGDLFIRNVGQYKKLLDGFDLKEINGIYFPYLVWIADIISRPFHKLSKIFPCLSPQKFMVFDKETKKSR